jgi:hypothetical protein
MFLLILITFAGMQRTDVKAFVTPAHNEGRKRKRQSNSPSRTLEDEEDNVKSEDKDGSDSMSDLTSIAESSDSRHSKEIDDIRTVHSKSHTLQVLLMSLAREQTPAVHRRLNEYYNNFRWKQRQFC